ncbi:hypothetical protein [Moorena sp. SIO4G3]|uniref:hypothetical protein n=1 Tax=Moorena sp. SIO4G3 TaxID=2607821 RepID=UPI00142B2B5D|nr:hypothetical protein [Moorena sp. SIO4G3]NEO77186.1 hypothetical protein [Moorena sp. SIO4G3]
MNVERFNLETLAKRPRYANNNLTYPTRMPWANNLLTLAKRPRYGNNKLTLAFGHATRTTC